MRRVAYLQINFEQAVRIFLLLFYTRSYILNEINLSIQIRDESLNGIFDLLGDELRQVVHGHVEAAPFIPGEPEQVLFRFLFVFPS